MFGCIATKTLLNFCLSLNRGFNESLTNKLSASSKFQVPAWPQQFGDEDGILRDRRKIVAVSPNHETRISHFGNERQNTFLLKESTRERSRCGQESRLWPILQRMNGAHISLYDHWTQTPVRIWTSPPWRLSGSSQIWISTVRCLH